MIVGISKMIQTGLASQNTILNAGKPRQAPNHTASLSHTLHPILHTRYAVANTT